MPRLFFNLGRAPVLVRFANQDLLEQARAWFLPAVSEAQESIVPLAEVRVETSGIEIVSGPIVEYAPAISAIGQLERVFLNWGCDLGDGLGVLHAGAVVLDERVIVFIAPSGSGKSTMTLAALDAGARYITDDTMHLHPDCVSGFARAIRFDPVPLGAASLPGYLERMDLSSIRFEREGITYALPVDPAVRTAIHEAPYDAEAPPVVVTVGRGEDAVRPLSQLERVVALHEAAIVRHGEYNGCLGPGPTFALTWSDPERAFALLRNEIHRAGVR